VTAGIIKEDGLDPLLHPASGVSGVSLGWPPTDLLTASTPFSSLYSGHMLQDGPRLRG
jgi:hypothetical protein